MTTYTVAELAATYGVSRQAVATWIRDGQIEPVDAEAHPRRYRSEAVAAHLHRRDQARDEAKDAPRKAKIVRRDAMRRVHIYTQRRSETERGSFARMVARPDAYLPILDAITRGAR